VRGIPGAHASEDGVRPCPESGEVVDVEDLETAVERSEKDDEQDADQDRREVGKVGTPLGAHEATRC